MRAKILHPLCSNSQGRSLPGAVDDSLIRLAPVDCDSRSCC